MSPFFKTIAIVGAMLAGSTAADAAIVTAAGSGWINSDGIANATGFGGGINNHYAGFSGGSYHNWFAFAVPNAPVTGATLSIYNMRYNMTIDPLAEYNVYGASSFSFAGLVDGASFGSVTLGVADNGTDHYVNIALNTLGVSYINSHLGSTVKFGGGTTSAVVNPTSCYDCVAVFGYNGGTPEAQLTLTEGNVAAVPEPASWLMMIAGFGAVGIAARRRRQMALAI